MFKHKFVLKVWDSKDKVSARARFDRPKAFRLPPTKTVDEIDLDTIRELLLKEGKTNMHLGKGFLMDSRATSTGKFCSKHSKSLWTLYHVFAQICFYASSC